MSKRTILIAAVALLLVTAVGFGTLAFFTDTQQRVNTFYVASSDVPVERMFSVTVTEAQGPVFTGAYPGKVFDKKPVVTNTGLYDEWVRVSITFSKVSGEHQWSEILGSTDMRKIIDVDGSVWTPLDETPAVENGTITYRYYYNGRLRAGQGATLFSTVTIPQSVTIEQMQAIDGFTISIVADAVQAEYTGDNAAAGFKTVYGG